MRLRHRVTFKVDSSADGEVDLTYVAFLSAVPCSIVPVSGGEPYRGKMMQAETTYALETRFYDGLLPNMIAVNDESGVEYSIRKVHSINGRDRMMLIEITEVVV